MAELQQHLLGRSGMAVTALGAGGGTLATGGGRQLTASMLQACWDAGLRYYDTAPLYGSSEHDLGRFLSEQPREAYVLSTQA